MPTEPRSIDEVPARLRQWPTWLLGRVHSDAKRMIAPRLAERGLHLHHYAVLACIAEFAPLSQQQVCERLGVDRADMVTVLDHLQAQELVSRTRDAADRRRYILAVTPRGRDKLAEADEIVAQVTGEFFAALTADEVATLTSLAGRVLAGGTGSCESPTPSGRRPT
jgi:MarR family transcriptional regulator, lower aerobic nicotinate degradation pathway regulator